MHYDYKDEPATTPVLVNFSDQDQVIDGVSLNPFTVRDQYNDVDTFLNTDKGAHFWGSEFDDEIIIGDVGNFYWTSGYQGGNDTVTILGDERKGVLEAGYWSGDDGVDWHVNQSEFSYINNGETHTITVNGAFQGLSGSGQSDTLTGDENNNDLKGLAGDDILDAGDGNDFLSFGSGDDLALGGLGDDEYRYMGRDGFNTIRDTGGFDTIIFHETHNINGGGWGSLYRDGDDLVYISGNEKSGFTVEDHYADPDKSIELLYYQGAEGEPYSILVRNSDEVIGDDQYDETLVGTAGDDVLVGAAGTNIRHDEFYGYTGNDVIDNSDGGLSLVLAGDGNDIVTGGDETDRIHGESGDDTLNGGGGDDRLFGGSGNDLIDGGSGDDTIDGGHGDDTILAGKGDDEISSGNGDDVLRGEEGNDVLTINGSGSMFLDGGSGEDTVILDALNYVPDFEYETFSVLMDLSSNISGGIVNGELSTIKSDTLLNIENIDYKGSFDSEITGDSNNNILSGDIGKDFIKAGAGDDTIDGGSGNNTLDGGTGNDIYHSDGRNPGQNTITDNEGSADTLEIVDSAGKDSYKLYVTEDSIVRESVQGREDIMMFTDNGEQSIEYLAWVAGPEYDPDYKNSIGEVMEYRSLLTIVKDVSEIDDAHIAYAGTLGDDTIVIPNGLTTNSTGEQTGSWGEIYLNDGDDNLTLPDTFYIDGDTDNPNTSFLYYTYGGEGDDIIQGGSGNDYILGDDGNDTIDGGDGNDTLRGGSG